MDMDMRDQDLEVLRALTDARGKHEALADLLDFYYDLYKVQYEAKGSLPLPGLRDEMAMRWRLEGGIPQLTFDQLALEPETFAQLVARVGDVLRKYNPQWSNGLADTPLADLRELARTVFETWDTLTAPKSGVEVGKDQPQADRVTYLAVGFALSPYLQRASEAILPQLDLALWMQGHCPICGGRANFALLDQETGARTLMCSRCNSLWSFSRLGCPYCRSTEKQHYHPSEDGVHRLYVCPSCNRYLKTVDLRQASRVVLPVVERLLTVGMDLAAHEEGYGG
jgi:FdhE protein